MSIRKTLLARGAFGGMTANERRLGRFLRDGAGHPEGASADDVDFAKLFEDATAASAPADPAAAVDPTPPAAAPASASDPAGQGGGEGGGAPAGQAAGDGGAAPAGSPPADGAAPAADPVAPAADPAAAPPPAADPNAPAAPSADEIVKGLTDLLAKQPPAQPQAPAAPAAPASEPEAPVFSEEEAKVLSDFETNWPDVARAVNLQKRAEYHDLLKFMFTQVRDYLAEPLETIRLLQNAAHTNELRGRVEGYSDDLEKQVTDWIATQPAYLQDPFKKVMQTGTTDEVADLIQRYQAATGTAPKPAAPAAQVAAPPSPPKTELSGAAKQAVEALAPVSAERTNAPGGGIDPDDFAGGFAHFAAAVGKS